MRGLSFCKKCHKFGAEYDYTSRENFGIYEKLIYCPKCGYLNKNYDKKNKM